MSKDYVTAGSLAAFAALACIAEARVFPLAALPILGVCLLAVFYTLARLRSAVDEQRGDIGPSRPKAMAALWYGLSILLGASLVRDPFGDWLAGGFSSVTTLSLVLGGVGVLVIAAAVFGLLYLLRKAPTGQ
ncbi:MAG: hypothetical protein MUC50_06680 [Myxococcota bacterium]|jgi:hypothetical protein|nr:hypothetical protein [Myxococcota bacterium]